MDVVVVVRVDRRHDGLARVAVVVADQGAELDEVITVRAEDSHAVLRLSSRTLDDAHTGRVVTALRAIPGVAVLEVTDPVLESHRGGKIAQRSRISLRTCDDLRRVYTPGVARVALTIHDDPARAFELTGIGNSVGIFTNGSRVLGLGDIGPLASMPVMEGKAVLYDELVGISATPILVDTMDPGVFIQTVLQVAPSFAGIHLEDIQSPECFAIEDALSRHLRRPVLHDDQHGTATAVLAAVIRACAMTGRRLASACVGQIGLGAAGSAIALLVARYGVGRVLVTDPSPAALDRVTNEGLHAVSLETLLREADVVIATTGKPGLIAPELVRRGQVVLALSNPAPEIVPESALAAGASLAADGRSINNALAFPGLFRGALQARSCTITPEMLIAAAQAIAGAASDGNLVPDLLNRGVHIAVAQAVERKAEEQGLRHTLVLDDRRTRQQGKGE